MRQICEAVYCQRNGRFPILEIRNEKADNKIEKNIQTKLSNFNKLRHASLPQDMDRTRDRWKSKVGNVWELEEFYQELMLLKGES